MLGIQDKTDFELERDTITSSSGRLTGLLPLSCTQNGLVKLNEDGLLSKETANVSEEIKCFLISGRSEAGDGECR